VDTGHFLGHSSGTQIDFGICKLLILSWVVVAASNLTLSAKIRHILATGEALN
jgi:hypothetical protein